MMTPETFHSLLRAYCTRFAASVSSYGRTALHNEAKDGLPLSAHQFWLAADVVYDTFIPEPARRRIAEALGLELVVEEDHDHLEPLDWHP